jgi:hypothetical protein
MDEGPSFRKRFEEDKLLKGEGHGGMTTSEVKEKYLGWSDWKQGR